MALLLLLSLASLSNLRQKKIAKKPPKVNTAGDVSGSSDHGDGDGVVTRGEFAHLKRLMCELDTRVRNVTLVPLEAAGVAVRAYGPSLQSVALLTALGASCPWPAKEEEEPPPLPAPSAMAVEPTEAEEEKSTSLASELLEDEADQEESHAESYALATVSDELRADFEAYEQHRTTPINRRRERSACLELTVANDRANALRFLGWLEATEGIEPSLGAVFASHGVHCVHGDTTISRLWCSPNIPTLILAYVHTSLQMRNGAYPMRTPAPPSPPLSPPGTGPTAAYDLGASAPDAPRVLGGSEHHGAVPPRGGF